MVKQMVMHKASQLATVSFVVLCKLYNGSSHHTLVLAAVRSTLAF